MKIGSLFSGVGGLELGLERAGLGHTVWQVEQDEFCRGVLAKHWPNAERLEDVREVGARNLVPVDLICGGFPCQPFSTASRGRRVAQDLWPEMCRIVAELRPRWVIGENVARDPVLKAGADLAALGYTARPIEIPSSVVGTAHDRVRWFVVANADCYSKPRRSQYEKVDRVSHLSGYSWTDDPRTLDLHDGVSGRMAQLKALGNAVVPQCAEVVGWMIRELEMNQ